jgi:hypothetical protein
MRKKKIYIDEGFYPDGMDIKYDKFSEITQNLLQRCHAVRQKSLKASYKFSNGDNSHMMSQTTGKTFENSRQHKGRNLATQGCNRPTKRVSTFAPE